MGIGKPASQRGVYRGYHSETDIRRYAPQILSHTPVAIPPVCPGRLGRVEVWRRVSGLIASAFKSRCPFFHPSDRAGREWWDLADSGRVGKGPDVP
jgi:hypothetical protein